MNGYGLYVQDLIFGFYSYSIAEMKNLINGLRRKHSAFSLYSVASFAPSVNTKEAMKQLCKHLYRAGVTASIFGVERTKPLPFSNTQMHLR